MKTACVTTHHDLSMHSEAFRSFTCSLFPYDLCDFASLQLLGEAPLKALEERGGRDSFLVGEEEPRKNCSFF